MNQFIKIPQQQLLIDQIRSLQPVFQSREPELDERGSFPFENINDLKKMNYHTLTLPKEHGGQGFGLYEYVLAQEAIAEGSGATALSIGWHVGIVLEYTENHHWLEEPADWLMAEIANGASLILLQQKQTLVALLEAHCLAPPLLATATHILSPGKKPTLPWHLHSIIFL